MDGTILNSLPLHLKAMKLLLKKHKIPIPKHFELYMGKASPRILQELKEKHKFKESIKNLMKEKKKIFLKLARNKIHPFPKVPQTLKLLKKNYKIALATGSTKKELSISINKNLLKLFNFISTVEDIKKGKPSPKQLLFTAKFLNISPSNCLVIGDSIFDIIAAKKAKMNIISISSGFTPKSILKKYHPIAILPSLSKLPNYLAKLA